MLNQNELERFWKNVSIKGEKECWLWQGAKNKGGYGTLWLHGKSHYAHRVAYGPAGYVVTNPKVLVIHSCDHRDCVNPKHLELSSAGGNSHDMTQKGRHGAHTKPERRPRGERHGNAKLTAELVQEIRLLGDKTQDKRLSGAELARQYGVAQTLISQILRHKVWAHVIAA